MAAHRSDICFDVTRDTFRQILQRVPGGSPDVVVVWEPGYQALPRGLEEASIPLVACYSDWNLVMPAQAGMLDRFDYVVTDRPGVRVLAAMGYENAEFWPMWGHDPEFSRVIPDVARDWDIGMVGNLNASVQRERAPWLARVARLSDRYRVRIAGGVYGEEYTRLLNATTITFNRSIRGEMNMRCYEAAACGSLLFYEEENEEIRDFFQDRQHCVLYNEHNLEELLDYYLCHEGERERIIAAARERVAEISFPKNLQRLADRLEKLDLRSRMTEPRAWSISIPEQAKRQARQAVGTATPGADEAALSYLQDALTHAPQDAAMRNDLAVIIAQFLPHTRSSEQRRQLTAVSLEHMRAAVQLCPSSAFYQLNLAHMFADAGWQEAALDLVQQALALLDRRQREPADPFCLAFPFRWDEYRVQFSALFNASRTAPESFGALWRCLLFYRGGMLLGRLAEAQGLLPMAGLGYRVAVAARGDLGAGRIALARVLTRGDGGHADADRNEAVSHLETAMRSDPFITEAWTLYTELLHRQDRGPEAREFLTGRLTMLEALSPATERLAMQEALSAMEEVRQSLLRQWESLPAAA